ncbi:MAG: glycyl-radical enzyme activating protein [Chloroflexi bacterium]|jgi:pyruvate formate lyase activating enzyme|nr:glycyl-radical enzyme activating protein [Chloroflexota bacterium]
MSDALALTGTLFDLDTFAVHDGPGIRMTVYLKGCPLRCAWCHSPESQRAAPELAYTADNCVYCGACAAACAQGVHSVSHGSHTLAREACLACGACVAACTHRALSLKGYTATAGEIIARADRMRPFFSASGGGITLTGGEVTLQPAFSQAVLAGCHQRGLHTAIETCGACSWAVLESLLPHTDLVLYDLKLIDDDAHRRWTGASNRQILANARRLGALAGGPAVQVRVPLIPGITDTDANLDAILALMSSAGLTDLALLPYNPSAAAKYDWLGRAYALEAEPQTPEQLAAWALRAAATGIHATID